MRLRSVGMRPRAKSALGGFHRAYRVGNVGGGMCYDLAEDRIAPLEHSARTASTNSISTTSRTSIALIHCVSGNAANHCSPAIKAAQQADTLKDLISR